MTASSSVVLYGRGPSTTLAARSSPTSLMSSRLFSQQTGTAIATELLYRLLFDILNRLLASFQRLASRGMEECSSWMERKLQERRERLETAKEGDIKIFKEIGKLAEERGFVTCPLTGHKMDARMEGRRGPPGPPMWVRGVLQGIEEGRMEESDFWIQTHAD
jgi:hypothetical protein